MTVRELAGREGVCDRTVRNWLTHGVWIDGRRVQLGFERVGGRLRITDAHWDAFRAATNPAPAAVPGNPAADQRRREREAEELNRMLNERGRR